VAAIRKRKKWGVQNGLVTASPLPGTTLEFIQLEMSNGLSLYNTLDLLVPGTPTVQLTPQELQ